jgi:hypothetical protein
VLDHRGDIASAFAIGACVYATLGGCAAFTAGAFLVRSQQRVADCGWDEAFEANRQDFLITAAGFGLVSTPASFIGRGSQGAHLAAVDRGVLWGAPRWQRLFADWAPAAPDVLGLAQG